jgi:hypothetical protein
MGDRLTVGHCTLNAKIGVRVPVPQPLFLTPHKYMCYYSFMIFDIWRFIVLLIPGVGIVGLVIFILGLISNPEKNTCVKLYKKWGLILMLIAILMVVGNIAITYSLLVKY